MSLTRDQESTLARRLTAWSKALAHAIREHGADNSFGVGELAGEYNLNRKDGYAIAQNGRVPMLEFWLKKHHQIDVVLEYRRGRYFTSPRGASKLDGSFTLSARGRAVLEQVKASHVKIKTLAELAAEHLGFPTLETRGSDAADMREVAVWNVRRALEQAYAQGFQAADRQARDAVVVKPS